MYKQSNLFLFTEEGTKVQNNCLMQMWIYLKKLLSFLFKNYY